MNILRIKKLFILLICFASGSHAAVISLACADNETEYFQYYLVKMDTNKKTVERTMQYIYGGVQFGLPRGYSRESEQQKKIRFSNLGDNYYQIDHYLTYSTKVAINRKDPKESRVWIDAQWWPLECEFIPDSIVDLKVAELNQEQEDRKSENIF
tara:strand:+ start:1951 stop:2412 length:462 start_codon:yes stop_codon:yes gene_type:complete